VYVTDEGVLSLIADWIELIGHGKDDPEAKFDIQSYRFNHNMIRIKDPQVSRMISAASSLLMSVKFYQEVLGMHLIAKLEAKEAGFDLYFLSFPKTLPNGVNTADLTPKSESKNQFSDAEGILELTHNHGTESDDTTYHNGNEGKDKQGFGHLAISVDNLEACCERFEKMGVQFKKKLTDGRMKSIAFIYDPDKCKSQTSILNANRRLDRSYCERNSAKVMTCTIHLPLETALEDVLQVLLHDLLW
jgi:lactoylglutathione lyase